MAWDPETVDALADRLLGPLDETECRRLVDEHADMIRSDELDGRLALRASRARRFPEYLDRVGALRHCLELARFNGFAETPRPASWWFQPLFEPGAPYTRHPPSPPEVAPSDLPPDLRLYGDVALALILARSWEERRRLLVAHADIAEHIEGMLDAMAATPEWSRVAAPLGNVVRDGRRRGWSAACADGPQLFPAETARVDVEGSFLTVDEQLQLVWLSYLEAPAWHQRREIILRNAGLLLEPDHHDRLHNLWSEAERVLPREMVLRARDVLDRARQDGVEEAFSGELPASQVVMAAAARAMSTATGASKVAALRTLMHFHNPSLWPTMHARLCGLLAIELLGSAEAPPASVAVEEASWRAIEATIDLAGIDLRTDPLARDVRTTLAQAQTLRQRGPRDRHVEAAIQIFESVAEVTSDEADAAELHANLAECLLLRISGVELENALRAVEHATSALHSAEKSRNTALLVRAHTLLGAAINQVLPRGESIDRSEAVKHLEQALALSNGGASAAMAHLYLGMVHAVSGPTNHDAAIHHLLAAHVFYTRERDPSRWAEIHELLGNALMRGRSQDPEAWAEARSHYLLALEEYDDSPALQLRCLVSLATTYFWAHDSQPAIDLYRQAIDLAEHMTSYESTDAGRLSLISALRDVHERAAYCLAQLGSPWAALEMLELGRATGLRRLYGGSHWNGADDQDATHLLRSQTGGSPIVVPLVTSVGSLIFVLAGTGSHPDLTTVPLPGTTDRDLRLLFDGGPGRRGWLFAYNDLIRAANSEDLNSNDDSVRSQAEDTRDEAFDLWNAEIWLALTDLGRLLMTPLGVALRSAGVAEGSTVRIVPSKWLSLVPLHAAPGPDGRPFMDSFRLTTLPALWLLDESAAGAGNREPVLVSLVADTEELTFAHEEARAVAGAFRQSHLLRADWDGVTELVELLEWATHLHIVCHGSYDWARPGQSGLELSDGSLLSAEILEKFPLAGTDLVTLSACETGLTESDRTPNEFLGLPGSLLAAGARTILSSLWVVDDAVTQQFMAAFYSALLPGGDPAQALANAQKAVRDAGYEDPFYWAAFTLIDCR
jgi:tetratricopeptide (TPR) repeat protein